MDDKSQTQPAEIASLYNFSVWIGCAGSFLAQAGEFSFFYFVQHDQDDAFDSYPEGILKG